MPTRTEREKSVRNRLVSTLAACAAGVHAVGSTYPREGSNREPAFGEASVGHGHGCGRFLPRRAIARRNRTAGARAEKPDPGRTYVGPPMNLHVAHLPLTCAGVVRSGADLFAGAPVSTRGAGTGASVRCGSHVAMHARARRGNPAEAGLANTRGRVCQPRPRANTSQKGAEERRETQPSGRGLGTTKRAPAAYMWAHQWICPWVPNESEEAR